MIDIAVALDFHFKPFGKSVNAADPHSVQTAGNLIGVFIKFSSGVQGGQNHLDRGFFFGFMHVHRDAAAVIDDRNRFVMINDRFNGRAISAQSFVDSVVHRFINQMVQPPAERVSDIHGRTHAHGFQSF
jgi:hypothetical protein